MAGITTTGNVQTDWFPEASVAVQITVVVPRGNRLPEGGVHTTVGKASWSSVAVTQNVTNSPSGPFAICMISDGHVIVGKMTSATCCPGVPIMPAKAELRRAFPSPAIVPQTMA
jgi:hypothetical protein